MSSGNTARYWLWLLAPAIILLQACSDNDDFPVVEVPPSIDLQPELDACDSGQLTADSQLLANGWTLNLESTRQQAADKAYINADNVSELTLKWSYIFADEEERRGHPSVTSEAVILGSVSGVVRALGRSTGCEIWQFSADAQVRTATVLGDAADGNGRWLYFGDTQANVYALDAQTGELRWRTQVDSHPQAVLTGSPQLAGDILVVPVSSLEVSAAANPSYLCCTFQGAVVALNAASGAELWRYKTMESAAVLDPATGFMGPSGAPIWAVPTINAEDQLVYVGTGENYSRPATNTSDAIIALDLNTGVQRWKLQATVDDVWNIACLLPAPLDRNCPPDEGPDLDFGAAPVLVEREGKDTLLIAAQKSGAVFALNPSDGTVIWQRMLGSGGNLGGIHWGVATDDELIYVPVSDIQSRELTLADIVDIDNAATIFQPEGADPGLFALELDTGVTRWLTQPVRITPLSEQRPAILSAAITLANGLVYTAALDGVIRVYDSTDGTQLWETNTAIELEGVNGELGSGGTIDSGGPVIAADFLYINSGYTTFGREATWFAGPGNAFMAYGLPE